MYFVREFADGLHLLYFQEVKETKAKKGSKKEEEPKDEDIEADEVIDPEYWEQDQMDDELKEVSRVLNEGIRPTSAIELHKPFKIMFFYDLNNLHPKDVASALHKDGKYSFHLLFIVLLLDSGTVFFVTKDVRTHAAVAEKIKASPLALQNQHTVVLSKVSKYMKVKFTALASAYFVREFADAVYSFFSSCAECSIELPHWKCLVR